MKHAFHPDAFGEYVAAASAYENLQTGLGERARLLASTCSVRLEAIL